MTGPAQRRSLWVGVLIGVGVMAAVDEIVFHQILAWHHFYDRATPELTQQYPAAHALLLVHLLLAGCLYTWAIAGPDPAPRRPGLPTRLAVLVVAAGAHAYLAKLLYVCADEHAHHGHRGGAAEAESAAQLMYYGGDVAEILLAVMLLSAWYHRRRAQDARRAAEHSAGPVR